MKRASKIIALLLAAVLLCAGCGNAAEGNGESGGAGENSAEATTMRLEKTTGEVTILDEDSTWIHVAEGLSLHSGYELTSGTDSYGWISLDDTKLAKMDQESKVLIQKEGRHLELTSSGSLFFNVTAPLTEDETMEIKVSNMIVGIRGTCGWVSPGYVYILEGTVTCEIPDENLSAQVSAGEMAYFVRSTEDRIEVKPFTRADIPQFVLEEIDDALINSIPETEPETETESLPPETETAAEDGIYTLPLSEEDVLDIFDGRVMGSNNRVVGPDQTRTIQAGEGEDTLTLHRAPSAAGHVIVEEGVTVYIPEGNALYVEGTLEVRGDIINEGTICVEDGGTLQVDGSISSTGTIRVGEVDKIMDGEVVETQNARLIVGQGIEMNSGMFDNVGYVEGTVTVNDGNISLMAGNLDNLILNGGLYIDDGGEVGEFTKNGGKTTSAAQGYRY